VQGTWIAVPRSADLPVGQVSSQWKSCDNMLAIFIYSDKFRQVDVFPGNGQHLVKHSEE
jgi:hypothetical protein